MKIGEYNFRSSPNLGIGKVAIKRILYKCDSYLLQFNSI